MDRNFLTNGPADRPVSAPGTGPTTLYPRRLLSGRPWHPRLIGPGAALLIAAMVTDIVYTRTLLFQWNNFSIWLLATGLLLAAFAALALLFDIGSHRIRGIDWPRFSAIAAAALLSLLNAFVHSRDAYTAVVPQGLELSVLVFIILAILGRRGWSVSAPHSSHPNVSKEIRS
jgi:uncharacterized membrane protein